MYEPWAALQGGTNQYVEYTGQTYVGNRWKIERDDSNRFYFYYYDESTRTWVECDAATNKTYNIGTNVYGQITVWLSNAGTGSVSGDEMRFDNFRFDNYWYKTKYPRPHVIIDDDFLAMQPWAVGNMPDGWSSRGTHDANNYVDEDANGCLFIGDSVPTDFGIGHYGTTDAEEPFRQDSFYRYKITISEYTAGGIYLQGGVSSSVWTAVGTYEGWYKTAATWAWVYIRRAQGEGACDLVVRSAKYWEE